MTKEIFRIKLCNKNCETQSFEKKFPIVDAYSRYNFGEKFSSRPEEPHERADARAESHGRAQRYGRAGADSSEKRAERDRLRTQSELNARRLSNRQFADIHWPGKRAGPILFSGSQEQFIL